MSKLIYITGDTHGDFERIRLFCEKNKTCRDDVMIILGDSGINYYTGDSQRKMKERVSKLPLTLFCIHGNHENRPSNIPSYQTKLYRGGIVYFEPAYPSLLFAKDGEIFHFDDKKCLAIGGAFSSDQVERKKRGYAWWPDEQPSEEIKKRTEDRLREAGGKVDIILSHTCAFKYMPPNFFYKDMSTELWLDKLSRTTDYKKWYCGHFHIQRKVGRMQFMFSSIFELDCG
jgi:3-oxoacid CoA-transferase subunit A